MRWFIALLALSACATTSVSPSEKLAFDYTQAFLRRDLTEMQQLSTAEVEQLVPSVYYSQRKVIRTCPPQAAKGGPDAQSMLVLVGDQQNQFFEAFQVTAAHYGDKWLVIETHHINNESGAPLMYSRSCQPVYGTYGGGTSY